MINNFNKKRIRNIISIVLLIIAAISVVYGVSKLDNTVKALDDGWAWISVGLLFLNLGERIRE